MKKAGIALALVLGSALPLVASAHSVVTPSETLVSKYETFTLGVPVEKPMATVGIRLLVPDTLDNVMPYVKPGWNVKVTKNAAGKVTELEWTGGSIPAEEKDSFQFSARTPTAPTQLIWKAYQTYIGGTVVAWDQDPHSMTMDGKMAYTPYSVTDVMKDTAIPARSSSSNLPLVTSLGALVIALLALVIGLKKPAVI